MYSEYVHIIQVQVASLHYYHKSSLSLLIEVILSLLLKLFESRIRCRRCLRVAKEIVGSDEVLQSYEHTQTNTS